MTTLSKAIATATPLGDVPGTITGLAMAPGGIDAEANKYRISGGFPLLPDAWGDTYDEAESIKDARHVYVVRGYDEGDLEAEDLEAYGKKLVDSFGFKKLANYIPGVTMYIRPGGQNAYIWAYQRVVPREAVIPLNADPYYAVAWYKEMDSQMGSSSSPAEWFKTNDDEKVFLTPPVADGELFQQGQGAIAYTFDYDALEGSVGTYMMALQMSAGFSVGAIPNYNAVYRKTVDRKEYIMYVAFISLAVNSLSNEETILLLEWEIVQ